MAKAVPGLNGEYWRNLSFPKWSAVRDPKVESSLFVLCGFKESEFRKKLGKELAAWQVDKVLNDKNTAGFSFSGAQGPIWVLIPERFASEDRTEGQNDVIDQGDLARIRNCCGHWYRQNAKNLKHLNLGFFGKEAQLRELIYGFVLADFTPQSTLKPKTPQLEVHCSTEGKVNLKAALAAVLPRATGHNLARYLTNLPANILHPKSYADFVAELFARKKNVQVTVWDPKRLEKENCHLLYHVGKGAAHGSHLVHIRYRPKTKKAIKPLAFVGKGITFDTGGLDIKPASNMRLMKKDMAGSAVVLGLAYYSVFAELNRPMDFYLALAENAVSENSTRPGDIFSSRAGLTVEIHNTDAEGRLAMADALTVAAEQKGKDEPQYLIDTSTLTGAMRVSLGLDVAGFFANDEALARRLEEASRKAGEPIWRMPLVPKYGRFLNSQFADVSNCSDSPFGGAITAALFLQKFIKGKKWAHFDVMSWNTGSDGAFTEGGNGQSYLTLSSFITQN